MTCSTFMVVLRWSSGSNSNFFLMMAMADSIGTDVKSAETSYEVIHSVGCSMIPLTCCTKSPVDCGEEYMGESGRTFAERFREHLRSPSPIYDHYKTTGHEVSLDNFSIVGRDDQSMTRLIREAVLIRVNDPSLHRNIGKYQLPHIWDEVLVRSPEMQLNMVIQ